MATTPTAEMLDELNRALAVRDADNRTLIARQAASSEVLRAISASPDDPQPVFELIARHARVLCDAQAVVVAEYDGALLHHRAIEGHHPAAVAELRKAFPRPAGPETMAGRAVLGRRMVQSSDLSIEPGFFQPGRNLGAKTTFCVPLLRDGEAIGAILLSRFEVREFDAADVALVESFAEQAVIAIATAKTLGELRARTGELQESLEFQTATSDVLKVISRSTFDVDPVFQAVLATAVRLCRADQATIYRFLDGEYRWAAGFSLAPEFERIERAVRIRPGTGTLVGRVALEGRTVQIIDAMADPLYEVKDDAKVGGIRTLLGVPLLRDGVPIGVFGLARRRVEPYTDRQIDLVSTFAAQAVIAIENTRLLDELRARTAELTRSVSELRALEEVLRAVNSSLDLETVLATIIERAVPLAQADEGLIYEFDTAEQVFVPRASLGMTEDRIAQLRDRRIRIGETYLGRSALERAPVHIEDVQQDADAHEMRELLRGIHAVLAVPLLREGSVVGGLVVRRRTEGAFQPGTVALIQTFAAQCVLAIENARLFDESRRARAAAEVALADLRRAQDRLVQAEKMASLGQLTAGIAHEIKNPLNFVNNFSDLSVELLDELLEALGPDAQLRAEIDDLTTTLKGNLQKIAEHGKRADGIVKNMLLHSRSGLVESRLVDLNEICEEALNLAYHGARANTPGLNITVERSFGPGAGMVEMFPQDFTRALLNLIGNGFYAATKRAEQVVDFEPTLRLSTRDLGEQVEIRVRDNGTGIGVEVREKIFDPFFTTKPAGEGTGLGLSLTFDIVVKQHGGQLRIDSEVDAFTEFVVTLPRLAPGGG